MNNDIFKEKVILINTPMTPEIAREIYLFLRDQKLNESQAFESGGYKPRFCRQVINEVKDILKQAIVLIKANPDITAVQLKAGINCTLLDVDEIGADLIKLFPTRDASRTFTEFKEAYITQE